MSDRHSTMFAALDVMIRTTASRRSLRDLDQHLLNDIGITRAEALEEASRAPWDLKPDGRSTGLWAFLMELLGRRSGRQHLARMDGRSLKDLGRGYAELELEANKPFWRA